MRLDRLAPAAVLAALLVAGCQPPDVGQRCPLPSLQPGSSAPPPTPASVAGDYLEFGNTFCDNLVCIVSPQSPGDRYYACSGDQCGYCSKPCVSDQDCFRSQTGLACRQMVLDPAFIAGLPVDVRAKYLADIQFSSYCAVPR
jgi:hypothetical protein